MPTKYGKLNLCFKVFSEALLGSAFYFEWDENHFNDYALKINEQKGFILPKRDLFVIICGLYEFYLDISMTKTFTATPDTLQRDWYLVDANGKTLGRLASEIAFRLRGKHKPEFTPNIDVGDYIIVINAEKIAVTGNKRTDKKYHHSTGYIGNLKTATFAELNAKKPEKVIELAVKGMLPKGPLGRAMFKKLKIYAGPTHEHSAQQPQILEI